MPNLKQYDGPTKLVLAFDIGMTFSGVSYCILERGQVPEVLGVTRFPSQSPVHGDAKIPSLLYYDETGHVRAAGAETVTEIINENVLKEGWTKAERWKSYLRPMHLASSTNRDDDLPPLPPGKTVVHILADFIKYLFHCAKNYIEEHHLTFSWSSVDGSIWYIFTHPNGWEDAQRLYHIAIERAGLIPSIPEARSRVRMLTEGEAVIHFCYSGMEAAAETAPRGVVVVDAGNETVDLSVFSITFDPISCEEIAPAECLLQGSNFVTRQAKALLQQKLEGWEHSTPAEIDEYTREFDQSTRLVIKTDQEPAYLRVADRRYNSQTYNISFGKLKLTGEEATGLFSESFHATVGAFERQSKSVTIPITIAFFVGELSTNDWLWNQLQSYFQSKNVNIYRPDNHINKAVVNGAVLSFVDRKDHDMIAPRVARATYGLVTAVLVDKSNEEHTRRQSLWEKDPAGDCYVPGSFEPKVLKGARISEETEFRETFTLTERHSADFGTQIVKIVCYRGSLPAPKWVDEDKSSFSTYCTIRADLSVAAKDLVLIKDPSGEVCYQLDYEVITSLRLPEPKAWLRWMSNGFERRVPVEVSFEDTVLDMKDKERSLSKLETSEGEAQHTPSVDYRPDARVTAGESRTYPNDSKELQERHTILSEELTSTRKDLQTKLTLIEENSRTITTLSKEIEMLRHDFKQLEERHTVQSEELRSAHDELQNNAALVEEKDRMIATSNGEMETLQQGFKDLEERQAVQSEELSSVHKELQIKAALIEEKDRTIATLITEVARLRGLDDEEENLMTGIPMGLQPFVQYGVACSLPVDINDEEHIQRKEKWEVDSTGEHYVPGYFELKLHARTDTQEEMAGRGFRDAFSLIRSSPADFGVQSVQILRYQGGLSNPKWLDEDESSFSVLCDIHADLGEAVKDLDMKKDASGDVYYQLDYDVIVSFSSTDLRAELCWTSMSGERRIPAKISYKE